MLQLLRDAQEAEEQRQKLAASRKRRHRCEYGIGWRAASIPRNAAFAQKLQLAFLKEGRCGLVLDKEQGRLRVARCDEPAALVNLEYLSLALQVRQSLGREPLFSLEPLNQAKNPRRSMQLKRFEPEWLQGTSLGEAMFQADYHLKELCFGEYEQPVAGMRSAFDFSEDEGKAEAWTARAWFVVRKAEVLLTGKGELVPRVEMGVEAREQERSGGVAVDVPLTRRDHPMVRYAESFTENFDLVAERRSVIFHLREVAKASVLAKYILEAQVSLADEGVMDLVDWAQAKQAAAKEKLEIPQLWKDRCHSEAGPASEKGANMNLVSLYGGVEFGLGRFNVAPGMRLPRFVPAEEPTRAERPERRGILERGVNLEMIEASGEVLRSATEQVRAGVVKPEGVDLCLDEFDLSEPGRMEATEAGGKADFWERLKEEEVLRKVYDPAVSDRREEGEAFVPPEGSAAYMKRLRRLVAREEEVQERRREAFLGERWDACRPGPEFPASWAFSALPEAASVRRRRCSHEGLSLEALEGGEKVFEKVLENGACFRCYRLGDLEVRSTQSAGGAEEVGAAFRLQACALPQKQEALKVTISSVAPAASLGERASTAPRQQQEGCSREAALAAVARDGLALAGLPEELRRDRELVLAAVTQKGRALAHAHASLREDKGVVLAAARQDAAALQHAPEACLEEPEIALAALQGKPELYCEKAPLVLAAVGRCAHAFELAAAALRGERSFRVAAVARNLEVMRLLPQELRANRAFMLEALRGNGLALQFASPELRADREVVMAALGQDERAAAFASCDVTRDLATEGQSAAEEDGDTGAVWAVSAQGGLVVRKGAELTSGVLLRLAQGARVRELELRGERLHFRLLSGEGPPTGWVSITTAAGKQMILREADA